MGFSFSDLLPQSVRTQWVAAKNKSRLEPDAAPSSLVEILYGATASAEASIKRGTAKAALATGEGKNFQQEATRQTVQQYLANPFVWVLLIAVVGVVVMGRR